MKNDIMEERAVMQYLSYYFLVYSCSYIVFDSISTTGKETNLISCRTLLVALVTVEQLGPSLLVYRFTNPFESKVEFMIRCCCKDAAEESRQLILHAAARRKQEAVLLQ